MTGERQERDKQERAGTGGKLQMRVWERQAVIAEDLEIDSEIMIVSTWSVALA